MFLSLAPFCDSCDAPCENVVAALARTPLAWGPGGDRVAKDSRVRIGFPDRSAGAFRGRRPVARGTSSRHARGNHRNDVLPKRQDVRRARLLRQPRGRRPVLPPSLGRRALGACLRRHPGQRRGQLQRAVVRFRHRLRGGRRRDRRSVLCRRGLERNAVVGDEGTRARQPRSRFFPHRRVVRHGAVLRRTRPV